MCGILAVFCKQAPRQRTEIIRAGKYLAKRGPDQCSSIIQQDGIYIFRRLAINDTSSQGQQPMRHGNVLMMCNGEIYNHKQLEKKYDIKCSSGSDCEIILHLYEKIGFFDMVKELYGVFGIVLVDGDAVYLARDRIGVRPLFMGRTEENDLAVASVPNALVSFCHSIEPILPGTSLSFSRSQGTFNIVPNELFIPTKRIAKDVVQGLHNVLVEAVKKRLMADRPMGCLLSGGLDSSIIAAILCKLLGPKNVRTYSIGMQGSIDLKYAKIVAEYLGSDHHEILFTPEQGLQAIPNVIRDIGSYDITTVRASVGMYLAGQYITKHSQDKVIFSGEGSDELLGGYLYFHNAPSAKDAEEESLRLLKNLHLYDVLRADRTISVNGLELRVPFLDRDMVDYCLCLPSEYKFPQSNFSGGLEKKVLREAFASYLPECVVNRRKDGMSDGVSGLKKPWYQHIQEHAQTIIHDDIFNSYKYPSKEAMYYHLVFQKFFPSYETNTPYWMPQWSGDCKDPSGRLVKAFDEVEEEVEDSVQEEVQDSVQEEIEDSVQEEIEDSVQEEIEDSVQEEIEEIEDSVQEEIEDSVQEEIEDSVQEEIEDSVQEEIEDGIEEEVEDGVEDGVEEEVEDGVQEEVEDSVQEVQEEVEDSVQEVQEEVEDSVQEVQEEVEDSVQEEVEDSVQILKKKRKRRRKKPQLK